jgi:ribose transport system permease protein
MALYNVIAARFMLNGSFGKSILISLLIILLAVAVGVAMGLIIGLSGVPDIVVTLAASFVMVGVSLEILGLPGGGTPSRFSDLAQVDTFLTEWLPMGIVILLLAWAIVWLPFRRSRAGLAVYAIGSDRNAAYLSGISVFRARIVAYGLAGVFIGLAGLALTATTGTGDANAGTTANYTLLSVAASVLGGVSLAGGVGGLLGPLVGAFILQLVSTILLLLNVDPNYGQVIQGTLIILVVAIGGLLLLRRRT